MKIEEYGYNCFIPIESSKKLSGLERANGPRAL